MINARAATAVMPNMTLSASPTPHRWIPTKIRKQASMMGHGWTPCRSPSDCTYPAMNVAIAAGATAYSMRTAIPVA
jgi:hypothetical protein